MGDVGPDVVEKVVGDAGPDDPCRWGRLWPSVDPHLLGREADVAAVSGLIVAPEVRLVTLTGPGGVGKTALSLVVANAVSGSFRDGVHVVDLAAVSDAASVLAAVGRAVGLRESGRERLADRVEHHLREREVLLVLDNCEQVLAAAPDVAALLVGCPGVTVLATSRAPLKIIGEVERPVQPLALPAAGEEQSPADLAAAASVALFVRRATAAGSGFTVTAENAATVAEICRRLDGLPLAIELAAARVKVVGVHQILARLRDRFRLLTDTGRAVPQRHRSLRRAVDWSYGLLSPAERALLRSLSVFAGGWDLAAAEAVCAGPRTGSAGVGAEDVLDLLSGLIDHSLVVTDEQSGAVRYRMLETLRQYGAERLSEAGEEETFRERHRAWFTSLAVDAAASWGRRGEARWLDRLEADHDNVRAALDYSLEDGTDVEPGLLLAGALFRFWDVRGYLGEGTDRLRALLARADRARPTPGSASAWLALGTVAVARADQPAARAALRESARQAEALGLVHVRVWALSMLSFQAFLARELDEAREAADAAHAVALSVGDDILLIRTHCAYGIVAGLAGDRDAGWTHLSRSLTLARRHGGTWGTANILHLCACAAWADGDVGTTVDLDREAVGLLWSLGDQRTIADCLDLLACASVRARDMAAGARLFGVTARLRDRTGAGRPPLLVRDCEEAVEAARAGVGAATYEAAWSAGHRLALERVIAEVLPDHGVGADTSPPDAIRPTRREAQIAALVAGGMTNRQIAQELTISERTAERHLENLRLKLGVGTRAEIAAWVAVRATR